MDTTYKQENSAKSMLSKLEDPIGRVFVTDTRNHEKWHRDKKMDLGFSKFILGSFSIVLKEGPQVVDYLISELKTFEGPHSLVH